MSTAQSLVTAEELVAMPADGKRYELVHGELRMMSPAGGQHGRIAMKIGRLLGNYVEAHQLGEVFAAETGFLLATNPDTVRAPDVAFVRADRYAQIKDVRSFLPIAPDLAVEVVSPNDSSSYVEEKANAWIRFGVPLVLVVDPANQSIRAYREQTAIDVYFAGGRIDVTDVVDGWVCEVDAIF